MAGKGGTWVPSTAWGLAESLGQPRMGARHLGPQTGKTPMPASVQCAPTWLQLPACLPACLAPSSLQAGDWQASSLPRSPGQSQLPPGMRLKGRQGAGKGDQPRQHFYSRSPPCGTRPRLPVPSSPDSPHPASPTRDRGSPTQGSAQAAGTHHCCWCRLWAPSTGPSLFVASQGRRGAITRTQVGH